MWSLFNRILCMCTLRYWYWVYTYINDLCSGLCIGANGAALIIQHSQPLMHNPARRHLPLPRMGAQLLLSHWWDNLNFHTEWWVFSGLCFACIYIYAWHNNIFSRLLDEMGYYIKLVLQLIIHRVGKVDIGWHFCPTLALYPAIIQVDHLYNYGRFFMYEVAQFFFFKAHNRVWTQVQYQKS